MYLRGDDHFEAITSQFELISHQPIRITHHRFISTISTYPTPCSSGEHALPSRSTPPSATPSSPQPAGTPPTSSSPSSRPPSQTTSPCRRGTCTSSSRCPPSPRPPLGPSPSGSRTGSATPVVGDRSNGLLFLDPCRFRDRSSSSSEHYTLFISSFARLLDMALDCCFIGKPFDHDKGAVMEENRFNHCPSYWV